MIEELNNILKKYVTIFINEYSSYLSKDQLESLKEINYDKAICFMDITRPFGVISLGQICLSKVSDELINNLRNMPNYNTKKTLLHNKNMSSYLKYMCDNGYSVLDYYSDILFYFVFDLVIKNHSGLVYGLINQEIKYLSIKYSLRLASIYAREEAVLEKVTPLLGIETCRKILFMDKASCFKYLNDNYGFRYANLISNIESLINNEYNNLEKKDYVGFQGFLDYTEEYDNISYGDVYNYILDFKVENNILS